MQETNWKLYGGIALIGILFIAGLLYAVNHPGVSSPVATSTASSTGVVTANGNVSLTASGHVTITDQKAAAPSAPNFKTPLTFSAAIPDDVRAALQHQFDATVAILAKSPTDFQAWTNLGIVRKSGGDYAGAEQDWLYLAKLYTGSTVPFDNLGELYLDFIKNYPKAEANFKQAIAVDPHDINAYQQLTSLYTVYGYKTKADALALVEKGLKDNPNNQTLLEIKAQLQ